MSTRLRTTTAAIMLAAAVVGTTVLGGTAMAASSAPAKAPKAARSAPHGTLTVSNGTQYVLEGGRRVDFHVRVRDLAWSPKGSRAAFIDGAGNLDTANPDGSGRVVVARNPGNQVWSHPTWQVAKADHQNGIPAKNNLIFAASTRGVSRLEYVSATAVHGTPHRLSLLGDPGDAPLPQTGNVWPSSGAGYGTSVYANTHTGEVYIRDDYLRQMGSAFTKGSEPALSADGEVIVFVRSVAGHDHVMVEDIQTHAVKDLTPHAATDYTEPAWSSDGTTVAARTPHGIVTMAADGSGHPVKASSAVGLPAYRA